MLCRSQAYQQSQGIELLHWFAVYSHYLQDSWIAASGIPVSSGLRDDQEVRWRTCLQLHNRRVDCGISRDRSNRQSEMASTNDADGIADFDHTSWRSAIAIIATRRRVRPHTDCIHGRGASFDSHIYHGD